MAASPLAAALLGGEGGGAGLAAFTDPAIAQATPDLQIAQQLLQGGLSTAPAGPWQALARIAQTAAGGVVQQRAMGTLAQAYAHTADNAASTLPEGHPLRAALTSSDPLVRMQGLQAYQKALTLLSEPSNLSPGQQRFVGNQTVAENTNAQSEPGKAINDATRLAAGGNPAAANAITSKVSKEGQIGETGVSAPAVPLNVPRIQTGPAANTRSAPPTNAPATNLQPAIPQPTADQMAAAKQQLGQKLQTVADAGITNPSATGVTSMSDQIAAAKGNQKNAEITGEANAKYYDSLHRGLSGSAMIAAQQKQNIDLLRQVAASPNFTPGAGSDQALALQRIAAQFGIKTEGAAPREIFNQVAARVLADQFSGLKSMASETGETGARIFKPMLDLEEKANLTHEDTLAGIKAKLDLLDRSGDLMMKWGDKADDYMKTHGKLDAGFDKQLRSDIAASRIPNVVPSGTAKEAAPANKSSTVTNIDPASRFKQLVSGGMTKEQAFAKMHAEGF
jgi:hypothetical protein